MKQRQSTTWLIIATLAAVVAVSCIWWTVVSNPANICIDLSGDGAKNYYTYLYHTLYGRGTWFMGMNYPYGEHIVYADGQPFLSIPLSLLRGRVMVTPQLALAVMHIAILLSFVLAIVFIYKTLLHFKV